MKALRFALALSASVAMVVFFAFATYRYSQYAASLQVIEECDGDVYCYGGATSIMSGKIAQPFAESYIVFFENGTNSKSAGAIERLGTICSIEICNGVQTDVDNILSVLAGQRSLVRLSIEGARMSPEQIRALTRHSRLESLTLSHPSITSEHICQLAGHPALRILKLAGTNVDDDMLSALLTIPQLREVNLRETRVTLDSAKKFQKMAPNVVIEM